MSAEATTALIASANDPSTSDEDLNAAAQAFFDAIQHATRDEAEAALRSLAQQFDMGDPVRAGFLALISGVMVEHGCDPMIIAEPITRRLGSVMELSAALAAACFEQMPELDDEEEDDDEDDPMEMFDQLRDQFAATMVDEGRAWEALNDFWRPAVAVYSGCAEARAEAQPLGEVAEFLSEVHEGAHWLRLILSVLEDEPIVVIEPATSTGIVGRISGIVDNFQLNVLLMDAFPGSESPRVPQEVVDVAKGKGAQESEHSVTGVWNLYTWEAIQPDFGLPDSSDFSTSPYWVWNEGVPDDIPTLDGHRVVLLGPASYPRSWASQRMFDELTANLEIEATLNEQEVATWLQKMLDSKPAE